MSIDRSVILSLQGVTKQFSAKTFPAVDAVSLNLYRGDLLGFLGPSGCGKTTLLRLIAGFEKPQAGEIAIAGKPVAGGGRWVPPEKRGVGMVFQDYALFPHLTVADNIAFGLQNADRLSPLEANKRVAEALQLVGLRGFSKRYPHQLSGGQQQRVALARALAPRPALVLLDEPLSNLDVQVRLRLRQELREILKGAGTSAIFVTHDQEEALSISDWVAVMQQGQLEQFGTPEEIYREPASRFVAEFVTQANFIPAKRQGASWETELGCFDLELLTDTNGSWVEMMVRQEDLRLQPDEDGDIIIRDRQFLGREHRYCLQTSSGRELIARSTTFKPLPIGTKVKVAIAPRSLRLFEENQRIG